MFWSGKIRIRRSLFSNSFSFLQSSFMFSWSKVKHLMFSWSKVKHRFSAENYFQYILRDFCGNALAQSKCGSNTFILFSVFFLFRFLSFIWRPTTGHFSVDSLTHLVLINVCWCNIKQRFIGNRSQQVLVPVGIEPGTLSCQFT